MVEINEYKLEKTDELNGLDEKLRPRTIKNRFLERLNRIKINKKKKDKWDRVIRVRNNIDETIKNRGRIKKFFMWFIWWKRIEIDEIIETEIRLEKLKIPEITVNKVKKISHFREIFVPKFIT